MVKPRCKSKSKRQSCSLKYRIRKNVANHNKKLKKQAKKNAVAGKVKQNRNDPGIPNSAPFKQQVLFEAEQKKQQDEEERLKRREENRRRLQNKTALAQLNGTDQPQLVATGQQNETTMERMHKNPSLKFLQDATTRKNYHKELNKIVDTCEVMLEVLDARDPLGCRCHQIEQLCVDKKKKLVILLNKIDLVPKQNVEKWLKYFNREYPTLAFKSLVQQSDKDKLKVGVTDLEREMISNSKQILGADNLLHLLSKYTTSHNKESLVVGFFGYQNVGKSSVLASIKQVKTYGIKSEKSEMIATKHVKFHEQLLVAMATTSGKEEDDASYTRAQLRNSMRAAGLEDPLSYVHQIISRCDNDQLMMRYNVGKFSDARDLVHKIGLKSNRLYRGGRPNMNAAARRVINEWNSGEMKYYSNPPEESAEVTKKTQGFAVKQLELGNAKALEALKLSPSSSFCVKLLQPLVCEQLLESSTIVIPAKKKKQRHQKQQQDDDDDDEMAVDGDSDDDEDDCCDDDDDEEDEEMMDDDE